VPGAYANGNFQGRAYYRFGDVVKRQVRNYDRDLVDEYWICVRPSFGMEGKGDSHWVSLNILPRNNVYYYLASNDNKYWLPKGLGSDKENMQNLAEMLYAIYYPEQWEDNVKDIANTDLEMFHDFHKTNYKFHNQYFWKNVRDAWQRAGILEKALNYVENDDSFKFMLNYSGLQLIYDSYSWATWRSWYCTLKEAIYKNGNDSEEKNMHQASYEKNEKNMKDIKYLDFRKPGQRNMRNYWDFFNGDRYPHWSIRHATGKELATNGKYNVKEPIEGVVEVYRYYRDVLKTDNLMADPEETVEYGHLPEASYAQSEAGTYMIGDVVMDDDDNRWFCITGSSACPTYHGTDSLATFISFDFFGVNTSGNTIPGLPTEEEIPELAYRMLVALATFHNYSIYKFEYEYSDGNLGSFAQHILDWTGVDLRKTFVSVDTVCTFTSRGETYRSASYTQIMNIAYNDGSADKQAVCRAILDQSLGGPNRAKCIGESGKEYGNVNYRAYLHYQTFDPLKMAKATDDEKGLGFDTWHLTWAMTDRKIYLQDVADQTMVDRYAKDDKWVTLPQRRANQEHFQGPRRQHRTQAATSAKPSDYIGRYNTNDVQNTNIFNEPVCFFRVMKVKDIGKKKANLVSTDGRRLRVVHLQNNYEAYETYLNAIWVGVYNTSLNYIYLDNQHYGQIGVVPGAPIN
jgi:hypothetical protein